MPKKSVPAKRTRVKLPPISDSEIVSPVLPQPSAIAKKKTYLLLGLVLLLLILLAANRGWVVAALVNGRPIFRWDLNKTLLTRFGKQTLEGMIGEALIADAAKKSGIIVSETEMTAKQEEMVKSFGGDTQLDELLKLQGMTKEDFDNQLRLQLTIEKLLTQDLTITESDIDNFIATNRALLSATDPAQLREDAKKAIISQAVSEKLQTWFLELKDKAKIIKFL